MRTLLLHTACLPIPSSNSCGPRTVDTCDYQESVSRCLGRGATHETLFSRCHHLDTNTEAEGYQTDLTKNTIPMAGREAACQPKSTLSHFNNLSNHHLPGLCGSVRGSTLEPGTGLDKQKRVCRVARGYELTWIRLFSLVRVP